MGEGFHCLPGGWLWEALLSSHKGSGVTVGPPPQGLHPLASFQPLSAQSRKAVLKWCRETLGWKAGPLRRGPAGAWTVTTELAPSLEQGLALSWPPTRPAPFSDLDPFQVAWSETGDGWQLGWRCLSLMLD